MRALPKALGVQGNLDPIRLIAGGEQMERRAREIISGFAGRPHVFNLGHGILPEDANRACQSAGRDCEGGLSMEWVKALHVISVIAWMAGLLYSAAAVRLSRER
jgi:hypothetical protein